MAIDKIITSSIADDAVGNTKLNLASNYAFTGTVTGAGDPSQLVLINTQTVSSNVSGVEFQDKISSTYKLYLVVLNGIQKDQESHMRVQFMNGGSPISSTNYDYAYGVGMRSRSNTTWSNRSENNQFMQFIEGTSGDPAGAFFYVDTLHMNSNDTFIYGTETHFRSDGAIIVSFTGRYTGTNSFTGMRFITSAGNYSAGTFSIYGVKKT